MHKMKRSIVKFIMAKLAILLLLITYISFSMISDLVLSALWEEQEKGEIKVIWEGVHIQNIRIANNLHKYSRDDTDKKIYNIYKQFHPLNHMANSKITQASNAS